MKFPTTTKTECTPQLESLSTFYLKRISHGTNDPFKPFSHEIFLWFATLMQSVYQS